MRFRIELTIVAIVTAISVGAQQRPVFDPDDFVDPRQHEGTVFITRLIAGGAVDFIDNYRPTEQDAGFLLVTNSLYWKGFQFDYKHSEVRSDELPPVSLCACSPPVYFPTPPPPEAIPAAPPPGSKDTVQIAAYLPTGSDPGGIPVMRRYRLTYARQAIDTAIASPATGHVVSRLQGREQSFGLDGDIYLPIAGHQLFGSFQIARTTRSGTADDREQTEVTYSHRFPGFSYKRVLFRSIVTVGYVSDRAGTAINVVNPYFEAFLHERRTGANFHLVYSPQALNSGAEGWKTYHQVALFADRALFIYLAGRRARPPAAPAAR